MTKRGDYQGLYSIGMAALFLCGFFLLLIFGARSYLAAVDAQDENHSDRTLHAYFATSVHAGDSAGGVFVRESDFGPEIVIADGDTGVGLHIYCAGGQILEEYAPLEQAPDPERAQSIAATEVFSVETEGEDLRITTDAGTVFLHLRAGGAA